MLDDLQVDLSCPPPKAVESLARQTAALFEDIGFIPTPLGVMMREEPDILDAMTDSLKELVESGYAEAEAAWRFGPSSV
jgi:hypothetical protein